jgi:hypothetical protein
MTKKAKKPPLTGSVEQSPLALPVTPPLSLPYRTVEVSRVPHISTILEHAWGIPREGLEAMSDQRFLLKWKWTHVARLLYTCLIEPVGYRHRAHHHVLPSIVNVENVRVINAEFHRRGMNEVYQLSISIPLKRGMRGEQINALIAQQEAQEASC